MITHGSNNSVVQGLDQLVFGFGLLLNFFLFSLPDLPPNSTSPSENVSLPPPSLYKQPNKNNSNNCACRDTACFACQPASSTQITAIDSSPLEEPQTLRSCIGLLLDVVAHTQHCRHCISLPFRSPFWNHKMHDRSGGWRRRRGGYGARLVRCAVNSILHD